MTKPKYYKKSRFYNMGYECTSQALNKSDIVDYILLDGGKNRIRERLEVFSWKKLMGIFYSLNKRDAVNALTGFN